MVTRIANPPGKNQTALRVLVRFVDFGRHFETRAAVPSVNAPNACHIPTVLLHIPVAIALTPARTEFPSAFVLATAPFR